jgi:type III pantothenate kinase
MKLLLDVGNSQIFGGVLHENDSIYFRFRKSTHSGTSSDEIGLFLVNVLRENGFEPMKVKEIGICSVVPDAMHSLKGACQKYFKKEPFILEAGVKTRLQIKYKNPNEVGADRIANAIGGLALFPDQDLLIVDLGTATTFCAVSRKREYFGGAIIPGLRISMEALESRTAKLPKVEILRPKTACGQSTVESIQNGLYISHVGAIKEFIHRYQNEIFNGVRPVVIGTGGFSSLFTQEKLFDQEVPDLVLIGLDMALEFNRSSSKENKE